MTGMLLRDVELDGERVDVRLVDGVVDAIGASGGLDHDGVVVDGRGGALLPGLHDHHVHLHALAARRTSVDVDPLDTPEAFDAAVRAAVPGGEGWVRVAGHDEHRHGMLDRERLDALVGGRKVRVQHRSGLAWSLSSAALATIDLDDAPPTAVERDGDGRPTGRLLRADHWLADHLPSTPPSLDGLGAELAAVGLTGVTDATPALGPERLASLHDAVARGELPQRLVLLGVDPGDCDPWASVGPAKLLCDEVRGLDPDALADAIVRHHDRGRPVAIHAVSRAETVTAVTALALAGTIEGDRIEHGTVLPTELDTVLGIAPVTVVVQPSLVLERGDHHLAEVDEQDLPVLHRLASLRAAGIPVIAGSDAPVTDVDPWRSIRSAVERRTRSGASLGPTESIGAVEALDLHLADPMRPWGPSRRVRPGVAADLVLLDAPLAEVLADPDASRVRATWVAGRQVHP